MKQNINHCHRYVTLAGLLAGTVVVAAFSQNAYAVATQVNVSVTYSNNLTNPTAFASSSLLGLSTNYFVPGPPTTTIISNSSSIIGTNNASVSINTTLPRPNRVLDPGHFGNVLRYSDMPGTIFAFANVSGATVNLQASTFFNFEKYKYWSPPYLIMDDFKMVGSAGLATANVHAPINTTIQSINMTVASQYIMGTSDFIYQNGDKDSWTLLDPATVFNLDIAGTQIAGSYIINEVGEISTFGDLTYNGQTGVFSVDASAVVGLNVDGDTDISLSADSRLPGDFNDDKVVDDLDIDLLYDQIDAAYVPVNVFDLYDLNIDGVVNAGTGSDVEVLVESILMTIVGDANLDRYVGIDDLNAVTGNWNQTGVGYAEGDLDGDNVVGIADLNLVLGNWGWGTPPGIAAEIPEPASLALLGLGGLAVLRRR